MKLHFIYNNSSVSRFSYNARLDINNLNSNPQEYAYYYKNIDYIYDLRLPANTEYYSHPYYDSINDKGGSIYMEVAKDYKTVSFLNMSVPINCDKFILKFAPLFMYNPIDIKNDAGDILSTETYMVLVVSIYVNNSLFIEIGFKSDNNVFVNNNSNIRIDDERNLLELDNKLRTKFLYESFYIILDQDKADIRLYDPYYYIYNSTRNEYVIRSNINYDYRMSSNNKYQARNIDLLPEYKQCLYSNLLTVDDVQFVNVILKSYYMNNDSIEFLHQKLESKKLIRIKEKYFEDYVNIRFSKRWDILEYARDTLITKVSDIINTRFNNIPDEIDLNKINSYNDIINYRSLCKTCQQNLTQQIPALIETLFNSEKNNNGIITKYSVIQEIENLIKIYFIKNNYTTEMFEYIMARKDIANLLEKPEIISLTDVDILDTQAVAKNPLTQIDAAALTKYKKLLMYNIYNTLYNIVESITTSYEELSDSIKNELYTAIGGIDSKFISIEITDLTIQYSGIKEFIRNIINNLFKELENLVILEMSDSEKSGLLNKIKNQLNNDINYQFSYEPYNYVVHIDSLELLCFMPYTETKAYKTEYEYIFENIFNEEIPKRIKFFDIISNYKLPTKSISISKENKVIR